MFDDIDPEEVTAFWRWLLDHQADLNALEHPEQPFWDTLLERLQRLDGGLSFELSAPGETPRELVVTAQGDWELFPLVEALVSVAPPLDGWEFVALKPAMGFAFGLRSEGLELDPSQLWFEPMADGDTPHLLNLRIAVPGFNEEQELEISNGLLLILETALGEKSAAMDVNVVDVCELPDDPEGEGFQRLPELASLVEWRKRRMTH